MEKMPEEVDKGLDLIYRLKSRYVERQGISQDVVINCVSKILKEELLKQIYDNPIEYKDKRVMIMTELPRQVILQRKTFKGLIEKLKKKNVRFRWELPLGVSFVFKGGRVSIKSEDQMEKFLIDNAKDFGE